ncbi:hypothetical protein ACFPYI_09110 [Halomarina salina]|uniref:Uncharacterized protein n=2 Tax=Halomarina salina TaxID=1872699 RepID=A0ABD5RLL9_9EURY
MQANNSSGALPSTSGAIDSIALLATLALVIGIELAVTMRDTDVLRHDVLQGRPDGWTPISRLSHLRLVYPQFTLTYFAIFELLSLVYFIVNLLVEAPTLPLGHPVTIVRSIILLVFVIYPLIAVPAYGRMARANSLLGRSVGYHAIGVTAILALSLIDLPIGPLRTALLVFVVPMLTTVFFDKGLQHDVREYGRASDKATPKGIH